MTGGRSLNPFGESGLPQEYPVVLMECRGVDPKDYQSGHVPQGAEAVSPNTCWTNTYFQRTNSASPGQGIWEHDASSGDDTAHVQGIDPGLITGADGCNVNDQFDYSITPFQAYQHQPDTGTLYAGCSSASMPPEATVNSVSIPNEVYAFTNTDGTGTFPFEVRTALENRSLGCSNDVPVHARGHPDRRHQLRRPRPGRASATRPAPSPRDRSTPVSRRRTRWRRRSGPPRRTGTGGSRCH